MKIYATRYSNPLVPFVGDDIWVRIYYYEGCSQFYIQILDINDDGYCTYRRVYAYDVDHKITYNPRSFNDVFRVKYEDHYEILNLVEPIEARTNEEIIAALRG